MTMKCDSLKVCFAVLVYSRSSLQSYLLVVMIIRFEKHCRKSGGEPYFNVHEQTCSLIHTYSQCHMACYCLVLVMKALVIHVFITPKNNITVNQPVNHNTSWASLLALSLTWASLLALSLTSASLLALSLTWASLLALSLTWASLLALSLTWASLLALSLTWASLLALSLTWASLLSIIVL